MSDNIKNLLFFFLLIFPLFIMSQSRPRQLRISLKTRKNSEDQSNNTFSNDQQNQGNSQLTKANGMEQLDKQVANLVNMTYGWAKANHPIALRVLQMAERMTEEQVAKFPKSHSFLVQVLNDSVNSNIPLDIKKYMDKHSNESILELIAENYNMTESELMYQAQNMGKFLFAIPGIKDQVVKAMTSKAEGKPFGFTLLNLVKHFGHDIHIAELKDPVFVAEIFKNVTLDIQPFLDTQVNKNLRDKFGDAIKDQYEKVHQVESYARNLSHQYSDFFRRTLIHYIDGNYNN